MKLTRFLCAAAVLASSLRAGITFNATFGSSITSDANASAIETAINNALAIYSADFSDNITVNITFNSMNSGLGQSNFSLFVVPYATFHAALVADSSTGDDTTALNRLAQDGNGTNQPVTGGTDILIKPANAKALGGLGLSLPASDGTIAINTHITDIGSPGTTGQYSFMATVEHEIDEILGSGSTLGLGLGAPLRNDPSPQDFFRFDGSGNRSFTASNAISYFSIDGTTLLAQYDNQGDGGDYGDWQSNPLPPGVQPQVQDAFATPGANPSLGVELRVLDTIGYDLATPEPSTFFLAGLGLAALWIAARMRGARRSRRV